MLKNAIQLAVELCVNLAKVLCKFDVHVHVFVTFFFFLTFCVSMTQNVAPFRAAVLLVYFPSMHEHLWRLLVCCYR